MKSSLLISFCPPSSWCHFVPSLSLAWLVKVVQLESGQAVISHPTPAPVLGCPHSFHFTKLIRGEIERRVLSALDQNCSLNVRHFIILVIISGSVGSLCSL